LKLSYESQIQKGTTIHFQNDKPVKILVGYFDGNNGSILPPPALETDANANNRGQADMKIKNAINIPGLYPVNIYCYSYDPGENTLELGKGAVLISGFIDGSQEIIVHDAGITESGRNQAIDWLFN
jgi:hypothetical protein